MDRPAPVPAANGGPLRIAYLFHEPLPIPAANAEQVIRTLAELARLGDITIDLVVPDLPGRTRTMGQATAETCGYFDLPPGTLGGALRLVEIATPGRHHGGVRQARFSRRAIQACRGRGYDLVYTRDAVPLALGVLAGLPVVFETYRLDFNTSPRFLWLRRLCWRRPNLLGVVTHSRLARQAFVAAGFAEDRLLLAYNGYAPEALGPALTRAEARRTLGLPADGPIVTYTGDVRRTKGAGVLLALARRVPGALFLLVGVARTAGPRATLEQELAEAGITNVRLVDRVPPGQLGPWLFAADVLVIPPTAEPLRRYGRTVLPLKTFTYLGAGRPILAARTPDLEEVLVDGRNAVLVPPDAVEEAAARLGALLADPTLQERLSRAALEDAKQYTWAARAARLGEFLRRRAGGRASAPPDPPGPGSATGAPPSP